MPRVTRAATTPREITHRDGGRRRDRGRLIVPDPEQAMRRAAALLFLVFLTTSLTACVIEEPGPGPGHERWCYWHPARCR